MTLHRTLSPARIACAAVLLALPATPAFAVNRDMVQLQTQVQNLQDAVTHLQQSNDERMGVLRDLVQQSADAVNKMSLTIDALEKKLNAQQDTLNGSVGQVSGQVQTLNDSVDEVKARLNALEKAMQAIQGQQQSINAALQNMNTGGQPAPAQSTPGQTGPGNAPGPMPSGGSASNVPSDTPFATQQGPPRIPNAAPSGPPVGELYKTALGDFMAAKYSLAASEFHDVIQNYPDDTLSGNAYFYLGEIDYHSGHFAEAVKNYDQVIQHFPANPKVPVSRLHKGSALLAMKDRQGGIDEMRALIQRYPNSPEASQARTKLSGLGVSVRRPS
ncbi:MAG TPA: tetratricopeptide repeat protein [Acidobacteriaceae bacterium]|nr:tetratricopeptide repeat protein [Acidobacteriaceae bacterium]